MVIESIFLHWPFLVFNWAINSAEYFPFKHKGWHQTSLFDRVSYLNEVHWNHERCHKSHSTLLFRTNQDKAKYLHLIDQCGI
jgi:hypothetical protein